MGSTSLGDTPIVTNNFSKNSFKSGKMTVREIWGGERKMMELHYAKDLEANAEANWSSLLKQHGRGKKVGRFGRDPLNRQFSSSSSPPPPNQHITSAERLKIRLMIEYEDRCFWRGLMGMVESDSLVPPSALKCALNEEEEEVEVRRGGFGSGFDPEKQEEKKVERNDLTTNLAPSQSESKESLKYSDSITGDTNDLADWKF